MKKKALFINNLRLYVDQGCPMLRHFTCRYHMDHLTCRCLKVNWRNIYNILSRIITWEWYMSLYHYITSGAHLRWEVLKLLVDMTYMWYMSLYHCITSGAHLRWDFLKLLVDMTYMWYMSLYHYITSGTHLRWEVLKLLVDMTYMWYMSLYHYITSGTHLRWEVLKLLVDMTYMWYMSLYHYITSGTHLRWEVLNLLVDMTYMWYMSLYYCITSGAHLKWEVLKLLVDMRYMWYMSLYHYITWPEMRCFEAVGWYEINVIYEFISLHHLTWDEMFFSCWLLLWCFNLVTDAVKLFTPQAPSRHISIINKCTLHIAAAAGCWEMCPEFHLIENNDTLPQCWPNAGTTWQTLSQH